MFNINVTMGSAINLLVKGKNIKFKLNNTRTASRLETVLPLEANAQKWGNEIYFSIPLEHQLEQGREILKAGDIAFWPPGQAFCIFFGKTPASTDQRPRAASPVTVLGHIADVGDIDKLKEIEQGQIIKLKLAP